MTVNFRQGSIWRRWDPHVHTPETILSDQFEGWDSYLRAIEAHAEVKVMGVTDYMSIDNYSKIKEERAKGRLQNIELLFPNIEFRISPPTEKATAVNLHLLISPDGRDHEQEIRNALARLYWEYNDRNYSCLPDQLTALGRAHKPGISGRAALAEGVTQFKIEFTKFRDWYRGEQWLKRNSLVAVDAGKDGLSGFRTDGGWAAHRDEITRFAQVIFSGRPGEREFWLTEDDSENGKTVARLGGPRACLHGSDAHSMEKLFRPDADRCCWVKADPTFEGLRQVLLEPGDRVHIGPTPPLYHDEARTIRAIRLSNTGGWFDETEIELNAGLVSIIGQKGSGKSALAEMIAYAAGSWQTDEPGSFVRRAGSHVRDLSITLEWGDGGLSKTRLGDDQPAGNRVRYLSQKFVEHLCADDEIGTELVREIEAVIFAYIDPTDTLNASTFEELRAIRTEGTRAEGDRLREDVVRLIHEECDLRDNEAKVPEKQARTKTLEEERTGLAKQMPKPASAEEAKVQAELQARRAALATAQQSVAAEKQKLQKISDIRQRIASFSAQMKRFAVEIGELLAEAGVPEVDRAAFVPTLSGDPEPALVRRIAEIKRIILEREGAVESPVTGTIRWLESEIKKLQQQESADKARQEKIKTIQTRVVAINAEIEKIQAEIAHIEGPAKARKAAAAEERLDAYASYFANLKHEQQILEELYAPVRARLTSKEAAQQEQDLEFSIRWQADLKRWLDRGSELFDLRRTIPYGTMKDLGEAAERILMPAWTSGNPDQIKAGINEFLAAFRNRELPPASYMRTGVTVRDVFEWLYEVEHVRLTYGLKYNGVELEKLSPGTKGIVLLILYLGMDVADTRPLIVDQPDENLDNESIYTLLSIYFKQAKMRRQVILITHNPNLVVNGDSEQVIVATCRRQHDGLPHITYQAGSLENAGPGEQGIRQQVCRILEGGAEAFQRRERRYALTVGNETPDEASV